MTFLAVQDGVLAVVTAVVGRPASQTATITDKHEGSRHNCDYFDIKGTVFLLTDALCASEEQLALARPGDQLILYGVRSPFGLNVSSTLVRAQALDAAVP